MLVNTRENSIARGELLERKGSAEGVHPSCMKRDAGHAGGCRGRPSTDLGSSATPPLCMT
jgi:hypothetical protein